MQKEGDRQTETETKDTQRNLYRYRPRRTETDRERGGCVQQTLTDVQRAATVSTVISLTPASVPTVRPRCPWMTTAATLADVQVRSLFLSFFLSSSSSVLYSHQVDDFVTFAFRFFLIFNPSGRFPRCEYFLRKVGVALRSESHLPRLSQPKLCD